MVARDWPIGHVANVYPGEDGIVLLVDVQTSKGCLKRAINSLIVLDGLDGGMMEPKQLRDCIGIMDDTPIRGGECFG